MDHPPQTPVPQQATLFAGSHHPELSVAWIRRLMSLLQGHKEGVGVAPENHPKGLAMKNCISFCWLPAQRRMDIREGTRLQPQKMRSTDCQQEILSSSRAVRVGCLMRCLPAGSPSQPPEAACVPKGHCFC